MSDMNIADAAVKIAEIWAAEQQRTVLGPWEGLAFGLAIIAAVCAFVGLTIFVLNKVLKVNRW
jgi:hypothetical protein